MKAAAGAGSRFTFTLMEAAAGNPDYKALYEAEKARRSSLEEQTEKLQRRADNLHQEKENLFEENLYLKLQLEKLRRLAFAQKRERFEGDPNQILLPFEMGEPEKKELEEQTTEKISAERKKRISSHRA